MDLFLFLAVCKKHFQQAFPSVGKTNSPAKRIQEEMSEKRKQPNRKRGDKCRSRPYKERSNPRLPHQGKNSGDG